MRKSKKVIENSFLLLFNNWDDSGFFHSEFRFSVFLCLNFGFLQGVFYVFLEFLVSFNRFSVHALAFFFKESFLFLLDGVSPYEHEISSISFHPSHLFFIVSCNFFFFSALLDLFLHSKEFFLEENRASEFDSYMAALSVRNMFHADDIDPHRCHLTYFFSLAHIVPSLCQHDINVAKTRSK